MLKRSSRKVVGRVQRMGRRQHVLSTERRCSGVARMMQIYWVSQPGASMARCTWDGMRRRGSQKMRRRCSQRMLPKTWVWRQGSCTRGTCIRHHQRRHRAVRRGHMCKLGVEGLGEDRWERVALLMTELELRMQQLVGKLWKLHAMHACPRHRPRRQRVYRVAVVRRGGHELSART